MFKTGDTIKCISNTDYHFQALYKKELTINKLYKVIECPDWKSVKIKNNQNKEFTFYKRFVIIAEIRQLCGGIFAEGEHRDDKDIILLQFTGLNDKNGKEIYEGDIFKLNEEDIYEVCWDIISGHWCLRRNKTQDPDFPTRADGKVYYGYAFYKTKENCEIIGNIYENPDLINNQ